MVYTDGVTEGRRDNELFGDARLRGAVTAYTESASSVTEGILGDGLHFQSGQPRDDIALVAVRVL